MAMWYRCSIAMFYCAKEYLQQNSHANNNMIFILKHSFHSKYLKNNMHVSILWKYVLKSAEVMELHK